MTTISSRREFIPGLHGLRGIMAVWVVLLHTSPTGLGPIQFTKFGYYAVDVFFILSGFVLMQGYSTRFMRLDAGEVGRFLAARWWRIYPVYLVSVALAAVVFLLSRGAWPAPERVLESLLILDTWARPGIGLNTAAWSLGVEWLGYLGFPFLAWFLHRCSVRRRLILLGLLVLAITAYMFHLGRSWDRIFGLPPVLRMASEFSIGCVLFGLRPPPAEAVQGPWLLVFAVTGLAAVLFCGGNLMALPFLILLVHAAALPQSAGAARLLGGTIPLFLGRISFPLYIMHEIVIAAVDAAFGRPQPLLARLGCTLLAIGASLILATILCLAIEEPARRWGRRKGAFAGQHTGYSRR